jgi:hypothetical protein
MFAQKKKQKKQCTDNATLWRVRVTVVAMGKKKFLLHILSVCLWPLRVCAYYIAICGLFSSTTFFPRYFINGKILWKKSN